MKYIILKKVICIALCLFFTNIANAGISLGFGSPTQAGNSIDIDVVISGLDEGMAPSVSTYDLDVIFESSHLSFSNAVFGDPVLGNQLDLFDIGLNISGAAAESAGVVNIYEISFDDAADLNDVQEDNFTLATLTFNVLQAGNSQLSFFVNDLGDADANFLTANLTTATVTTVPVPGALWLMISGLGILYRKHKLY